jgi:hypothetical protein
MVDKNIKKVIIKHADLPEQNRYSQGHTLRYRIVSEDKNRTSAWSSLILIKPEYTFVSGSSSLFKNGTNVVVIWDPVKTNKIVEDVTSLISLESEYDVWVKWDKNDSGDWLYRERIKGTSMFMPIPTTYSKNGINQVSAPTHLSMEIYLKGFPIARDVTYLKAYSLGPLTL